MTGTDEVCGYEWMTRESYTDEEGEVYDEPEMHTCEEPNDDHPSTHICYCGLRAAG